MCLIYKQINVQVEESGPGKSCDQRVLESRHRPGSLTLTSCGWGPPDSRGRSSGLPSGDCRALKDKLPSSLNEACIVIIKLVKASSPKQFQQDMYRYLIFLQNCFCQYKFGGQWIKIKHCMYFSPALLLSGLFGSLPRPSPDCLQTLFCYFPTQQTGLALNEQADDWPSLPRPLPGNVD